VHRLNVYRGQRPANNWFAYPPNTGQAIPARAKLQDMVSADLCGVPDNFKISGVTFVAVFLPLAARRYRRLSH